MNKNQEKNLYIFGEVLWDKFPDEQKNLGGAPFNVAWNLKGFRAQPLFISAVGNDSLGDDILKKAEDVNQLIFDSIQELIALRKSLPGLAGMEMKTISTHNPHVFAYDRYHNGQSIHIFCNFSEHHQTISRDVMQHLEASRHYLDLISDESFSTMENLTLMPHQFMWLIKD